MVEAFAKGQVPEASVFVESIEIKEIGCDDCGLIAPAEDFAFGENDPRFAQAVAIRGFDMLNPNDLSTIQTLSAGIACLSCGNFSSFDTHPNEFPYPPEQ